MHLEKRIDFSRYAAIIICILGALGALYIVFKYLLWSVLPFAFSWGVAFAIRPLSEYLHRRTSLPKKALNFCLVLLALLLVFSLLFIISDRLVTEIRDFIEWIEQNPGVVSDTVGKINSLFERFSSRLDIFKTSGTGIDVRSYISEVTEGATQQMLSSLPSVVGKIALTLPKVLIFTLITVISAFYFSIDLKKINDSVLSPLPQKWRERLVEAKDILLSTTVKYLRSYLIIMLITFSLLLIGFLILGVKYYFVLSVIFALIDILPLLGVGTLLIPWGIFSLATGDLYLGMGLLVLYAIIVVVRQIAEPKIIGVSLGIHPLLTLFAMYLGFTVLGFVGMILGPFVALIARSIASAFLHYRSSSATRQ